ncbi:MAG: hypothetical protein K6E14_12765 [Paludibacteraceae bacterium]|nr:hypothetical protein [Paludibacteraceae bacterium]
MNSKKIFSVPRSLFYNIILFGKKGLKLPIIFSNNTKIIGARFGAITISDSTKRISFGFGGSLAVDGNRNNYLVIGEQGRIIFDGKAVFCEGISMRVDSGTLHFGKGLYCNKNCFFLCNKYIHLGDDCVLGWNINVRDTDGHSIYVDEKKINNDSDVVIGNNVWIASFVDILKGSIIPDGCVIGCRSCITKTDSFTQNSIYAGYPAHAIRDGIIWKV